MYYLENFRGFNGSTRSKREGKKDSLTNPPTSAFDFSNMSTFGNRSGVVTTEAMSPGIEGETDNQNRSEEDLLIPSTTFKLCQRSQCRRNTDFSQASQDLKKFLAAREKRRDSDQEILDILPPPSYK